MTGLHELKATALISARQGYVELKLLLLLQEVSK